VVMLHVGSAIGLLAYFWRDWVEIVTAFFRTLPKRRVETSTERLAWLIVVATIPAGILGLVLEHPLRTLFAKPLAAAIFLMVNGVVLATAEVYRRRDEVRQLAIRAGAVPDGEAGTEREEHPEGAWRAAFEVTAPAAPHRRLDTLDYREAGVIGVAQSTALLAGISREGVCMGAGLARGLDHSDSARFAFLLATPIIVAAGLFKLPDLLGPHGNGIRGQAAAAAVAAAIAAYFTVRFLVGYFKTKTLSPFAAYCVLFGLAMVVYTQT
ncbi:MAG: undecaprenyl-diphosphate phosphatase, partial [Acidobacteriota bacterium]|nr:undecaprenyl-diphosphate phosphatase [Acidobacteriota bacterium]